MTDTAHYLNQTIDGKYRIERLLGKGGMGAVYLAEHVVLGKQVAIKFLHQELADDEEIVKRFYREAQAATAIGHKNIIEVFDVGTSSQGEPYMVMEYLTGKSLAELIERTGPIDLQAACGILEPTLQALEQAHDRGIVHRDLKPENIFLVQHPGQPPQVKLIDFGISKFTSLFADKTKLTQVGSTMGTPAYMAPEQARGEPDVDHRADLYSVGVVLYEMLTGRKPFDSEQFNTVLIDVLTTAPKPPSEIYVGFPKPAEPLILKMLAKEPSNRLGSAAELLSALKALGGFENREARLYHYSSSVDNSSFAGGDLGDGTIHENLLAALGGESTLGQWGAAVRSKRKLIYVAGFGGFALVVGLLVISFQSDPADVPPEPTLTAAGSILPQPTPSLPSAVEITLRNLPPEAKIFYNNSLVPMNPFAIERKATLVPIRVEAPGYKTFSVSVLPVKDSVVEVTLEPVGDPEIISEKKPEPKLKLDPDPEASPRAKRHKKKSSSRKQRRIKERNSETEKASRRQLEGDIRFHDNFE